ncbi:hypothetical protein [Sinosporangium siamense]|uniref:hypothetical protein n=1 Tax=Sinosporangium siamense TaxID=1367973 RepID=UPI001951A2A2|nr:hypothetical protein [Sinosporangium siamense]
MKRGGSAGAVPPPAAVGVWRPAAGGVVGGWGVAVPLFGGCWAVGPPGLLAGVGLRGSGGGAGAWGDTGPEEGGGGVCPPAALGAALPGGCA